MKNERKREALKQYEATMGQACDIRREAISKANTEFEATKEKAKQKYKEAQDD